MLLRSSSSPVLESLLAPLQVSCHSDPSPDIIKHDNLPPDAVLPKSLSFSTRGITSYPISTFHTLFDPHFLPSPHGACPSFGSIRRVLSENDLSILGSPRSSSTPALFAANSLLQDDNAEVCPSSDLKLSKPRSHHPHVKKGRMPLTLSRRRSLGAFPSTELLSMVFDGDSAILEEGDLASLNSSATSDEEDERERSICIFDKLALPVGVTSNVKVERANDTTDVRFKLNMVDDSCSSQITSDKTYIHGVGGEDSETGLEMNLSKHGADAAFSGRQEPSYVGGQGTSRLFEGGTGTTLLVPQEHGQASQPKYVYHGDMREMALGAGAGGRGPRPPISAGRGRGGGEAGGCGGRNSDPTELHYQSMLKDNPSHSLILQNYAQYLAEVKRDYQKAEEFFQRAILVNPSDGELLGQYAKLLWEVQQDRERAATYFERAVQAAPDNSYVMAAYASFLWSAEEEEEEEQQETVEEVKGSSPANVPSSIYSLVSAGLL